MFQDSTVRFVACRVAAARGMAAVLVVAWLASALVAQQPPVHYNHAGILMPGAIGAGRLEQGGPLPGYFQPVEISAPEGTKISLAVNNQFTSPQATPLTVGMFIAPVYRLRVTEIPLHVGQEVFPTIEIIDRTYPPPGLARRFPIPIQLTREELDLALSGSLVTRIIYLENPLGALPVAEDPTTQTYFEVKPGDDPLAVADHMGRPVAILRMGSRMPDDAERPDAAFMYNSPPLEFYGPDDRTQPCGEMFGCSNGCCVSDSWAPPGIARPWPSDEYICDGGDKDPHAAVRADWRIAGLQLEDTIAHYDTLAGETVVEPANRVCIYAPRFAAVRKVDGPILTQHRDRPAGVLQPEKGARTDDLQIATTALQPIQPIGELGTKRPTILREKDSPITDINEQSLVAFQDRFAPYEDFNYIRVGILQQGEKARLAQRVQAAIVWEIPQAVQVMIEGMPAHDVTGDQKLQTTFTVNTPTHPCLKICKVASTSFARPGEYVDFTLRFDNTGNQTIGNVTIVDNLTTRLEYVEGSAQSNIPACFATQANEGDSLVLRWELTNPLKPGEGGIVRFRCRVR